MVMIEINKEKIQKLAYQLSQEQKSYDDWIWLLAEAELRLRPAYVGSLLYQEKDGVLFTEIDATLMLDEPSEEVIHQLAEEIAKSSPSVQELHWFIAERRYIYDSAKNT
jgi:hypothetical protein